YESPMIAAETAPDFTAARAAAASGRTSTITVVPEICPAVLAVWLSAATLPPATPMRTVLLPPCSSAGMTAPHATPSSKITEAIQKDLARPRSPISRLATSQVADHHSRRAAPRPLVPAVAPGPVIGLPP